MAVKRNYRINLRNYGNPPAIMVSQYDENYDLVFEVYDGVVPATGLNAYTVKLVGRQPGNDPALKYEFTGTVSGIANNILSFTIDTTMTGRAGKGTAEIVILDTTNDVKFASFNLPVYVEKAAVPDDAIDADVERAQEIADEVQEIVDTAAAEVKGEAEAWAVGQRDGEDVPSTDPTYENNAKYYAESISGVTDQVATNTSDISDLKEDLTTETARAKAEEARIEALFTQPVEEAVSDWLDDHPEATTTVQDDSLTEEKFTSTLKLSAIKDYVTPQMFGAVGDGETDDTSAFQMLDGKVAFIPKGTYMITSVEYGANTVLVGSGMENTIITQISGTNASAITFKNAHSSGITNLSIRGDKSSVISDQYVGLLRIYTDANKTNSSHYCNYEHLLIRNAPSSGLVLLGTNSSASGISSSYNWVLHFNDLRIEECNNWCMIDETTDNMFSNFYLNEGELGNLKLNHVGNNLYCNFKIDQPYGSGGSGSLDGYDDGALMLIRNSSNCRFINFDLQSPYYDALKIYSSSVLYFDGTIGNVGWHNIANTIGIKMDTVYYSDFHVTFQKLSGTPKYNVYVESTCHKNTFWIAENVEIDNYNGSSNTVIIKNSELYKLFKTNYDVSRSINNLLSNPEPISADAWSLKGFTLDTTSQIIGTSSFKVADDGTHSYVASQTISGIKANHYYMAVVTVKIEQTSNTHISNPAPYLTLVQNNSDISINIAPDYLAKNEVGTQVIATYAKPTATDDITLNIRNYKNDCIAYVGNVYFFDMTKLYLTKLTNVMINATLQMFKDNPLTVIEEITENLNYTNLIDAVNDLLT